MLTGTSFPTTAFLSNGIDRAERYCADTTPTGGAAHGARRRRSDPGQPADRGRRRGRGSRHLRRTGTPGEAERGRRRHPRRNRQRLGGERGGFCTAIRTKGGSVNQLTSV